jgi:hypothetical protein
LILEIALPRGLTKKIGDVPEMHKLTDSVRQKVLKGFYGNVVEEFEIYPMVNTQDEYDKGMSQNGLKCSWGIGLIFIFTRMSIDYEVFCNAPAEEKVYQAAKTALDAIKHIKKRARGRLDCNKLLRDVFSAYDKYIQEKLLAEGYKIP